MVTTLMQIKKKEKEEKRIQKLVEKGVLLEKKGGGYAYSVPAARRELFKQEIKQLPGTLLESGKPVNVGMIQSAPQTLLSKEQRMLNSLFNQKNQLWGNGQPVQINRTLTSGWGLIKTGDGDATRRLMF